MREREREGDHVDRTKATIQIATGESGGRREMWR
jgi:hypothetical protein